MPQQSREIGAADALKASSPSLAINAFSPPARETIDWCRCQPEANTFGSFGRHMKVA